MTTEKRKLEQKVREREEKRNEIRRRDEKWNVNHAFNMFLFFYAMYLYVHNMCTQCMYIAEYGGICINYNILYA